LKKRKTYDDNFKAQVASEAIKMNLNCGESPIRSEPKETEILPIL